ncbi:MAG: nucleotidyltransferase domain-containing protein [Alphaproteobacteria bacterium]|nr:nucleotidyltransferase domain-containing protein [Alphaproteobacteria bacterium]
MNLNNCPIRLPMKTIDLIKKSFKEIFKESDHLWIFGSRVDPKKHGGDIDLYIETQLTSEEAFKRKIKLAVLLVKTIGDQKIDIVLKYDGAEEIDIYNEAKETGVLLV